MIAAMAGPGMLLALAPWSWDSSGSHTTANPGRRVHAVGARCQELGGVSCCCGFDWQLSEPMQCLSDARFGKVMSQACLASSASVLGYGNGVFVMLWTILVILVIIALAVFLVRMLGGGRRL